MGDGKTVQVEAIGVFRLLVKIEFYLDLNETFVVPSLWEPGKLGYIHFISSRAFF